MKAHWRFSEKYPGNCKKKFPDEDDLTCQLLFNRGIKNSEERNHFFYPNYEDDLFSPFKMADMEKAALRIIETVKSSQKIVIIGDYDVDGACGSAVFFDFFKAISFQNFEIWNLDRDKETYGLNRKILERIETKKPNLVITVDFGISNLNEAKQIKDLGIDLIITDHHLPKDSLPEAYAVVDPLRKKDGYPFKGLAGAGVAFKIIQAILQKNSFGLAKGYEKWSLDLIALATISDLMELRKENRALVYYGLKVLNKAKRLGLKTLAKALNLKPKSLSYSDLAYYLIPALNSKEHSGSATLSYKLLTTRSKEEAERICALLVKKQKEVKKKNSEVIKEIKNIFSKKKLPKIVILGSKKWSGVSLGLTASRLAEILERPVCLFSESEAGFNGSCRSDGSVHLVKLMEHAGKDLFVHFGGHPMAAGFTVKKEKIKELPKLFLNAYLKVREKKYKREILIEKELELEEVDSFSFRRISLFSPFGKGNPSPIFLFRDLLVEELKLNENSFKIIFAQKIEAWAFNHYVDVFKKETEKIKAGSKINLLASIEKRSFSRKPFLKIVDLEIL